MTVLPATITGQLVCEYQDANGDWQRYGAPVDLGAITRTRRFSEGPRGTVTARHWRIKKLAGYDWGDANFSLANVHVWAETDQLSPVRISAFSFDDETQRYFLVRTDRNVEVYHQGVRAASIQLLHTGDEQSFARTAQVLDTMLLFHPNRAPQRITRQGAHDQWDSRRLQFGSLPLFDYTGSAAGGVNDVQQIKFSNYADGDTFNVTVEGEVSPSILYSTVPATLIANLTAALEGLGRVGTGGVVVTNSAGTTYRVEFIGGNASQDVGEMAPRTLIAASGSALAIAATLTQGKEGGEDIVSDLRGWPGCGTFHQGRLWMAGLKSRPQTAIASRIGDWFEFKSKGSATAISLDLDTNETTTISAMFPGQHLQMLTSSAEFFFPQRAITPPPEVTRATVRGIAAGVPLAEIAGATLFVPAGGGGLCEFLYDQTRENYVSSFLSKWANHLFAGTPQVPRRVIDMGFRRAKTATECDRAILPRDDGLAVVMHALREDDVVGFVRWATDGKFLAAAADLAREEYVAVLREVDGVQEVLLEKVDPAAWLDAQVRDVPVHALEVTELTAPHLAGRTVAVVIDGEDAGDVLADADGLITLPWPALREVSAGIPFEVRGVTLPAVLEQDKRAGKWLDAQVCAIGMELGPSSAFQIGLAGGKTYPMKLRAPAPAEGLGALDVPFQGWDGLDGFAGFRADAQVQFVKTRPGPLQIKQIVVTIDT